MLTLVVALPDVGSAVAVFEAHLFPALDLYDAPVVDDELDGPETDGPDGFHHRAHPGCVIVFYDSIVY
jgi:hypothetical protein